MDGSKKSPLAIGGAIVLVLAIAGYGAFKYIKSDSSATQTTDTTGVTDTTTSIPPPPNPTPTPPEPVTNSSTYKDGTYSSRGGYFSPGGAEQVDVQVTLKDDIITDAKVTSLATRPNSVIFQGKFVANFKPLVVGRDIDEVRLSKVSGSSLTSGGFNDALAKIKAEAKA